MRTNRLIVLVGVLFAGAASATHAITPFNLTQTYNGSSLAVGGMVQSGGQVGITATNSGSTWGGTYTLEIEVRPAGTAFTGVPTHYSSGLVTNGYDQQFPVTYVTLSPGSYHWQVRENTGSNISSWAQFNAGGTAFTVGGAIVSPATLSFNTVRVNATSPAQTVTFTNSTSSAVTLNSASITGPFALSSSPTLPLSVAANGTATFQITATPTATGAATGTFTLNSSATNSPHTVALSVTGGLPALSLSTNSVSFGDHGINSTPATQTVTLTNTGNATLTLGTASVAAPFSVSGFSGTVAAGGTATFTVGFAPTATGPATATLTLNSDDPNSPATVSLSGNGIEPHATVSQTSIAFADTVVGASTVSSSLTLANTGTGNLTVGTPTLPAGFSTTLTSQTVAQGSNVAFTVTFTPAAPGPFSGNLVIPSDDANGPANIALSGIARAPDLTASPASVSYGTVSLGASQTALVTLNNPGDATLTVSAINFTGNSGAEYALQGAPSLPLTITSGGSTQLTVKFAPQGVGLRSAAMELVSDRYPAGNVSVALSGYGDGPLVSVNPASLSFGQANVNSTVTRTFNVANSGTQPLVVSGITFSTGAAVDYSTSQVVPFTVNAGSSTTVTVAFKPTQVGSRTSKGTVASSDAINPGVDVSLSGEGIAPNIFVDPLSLDFAQVRVGQNLQQTLTIQNTGTGPLGINGFMFTGNDAPRFSTSGINVPYVLQPNAPPITLNVIFTPTSVGAASASLVIASDDPDSGSLQIPVAGEGIAPGVAFSATSLNFGGQVVNRTSSPRTVDISNTGTAPLQVFALSLAGASSTSYQVLSPSTPFTVPAGQKKTISVVLTAKVVGEQNARMMVQCDAPGGANAHVDLLGLGISEVFGVSPATADFGTVKVGQSSAPVTITLQNKSGEVLPLSPAALSGPNSSEFNVLLDAVSIDPGATVNATVIYNPQTAGAHAATLALGSSDPQVPIAQVTLTGASVSHILDAAPSSYDFGAVEVGQSSQAQLFTITNKTSRAVTISQAVSTSPEFQVDPSAVGTIEAGKSRTVPIVFVPGDAHLAIGTVSISLEGQPPGQAEVTIPVSGTGTPAPKAKSGCSAAGGMFGVWSLLALAGLAVRRRRHA